MKTSPAVVARIRDWTDNLQTAFDRVVFCDVVVEEPHRHHRQGRQFHVGIVLTVPGGKTIAVSRDPGPDETHEDVYVAIRDTFRAARRRLQDRARRLRGDVKRPRGEAS
jgi:ribosome-associated translation inhibitor RaiA